MEIELHIHEHPLNQYDLDKERPACRNCDTPLRLPDYDCLECGLSYGYCPACGGLDGDNPCLCKECRFFVHRSCADKWPQQIRHLFHPLHPLKLFYCSNEWQYMVEYRCGACQKATRLLAYHCDECSFGLCLECVSMNPDIKIEDGNHVLYLYENTAFKRRCDVCSVKDRHTFIFICTVPKCGYAVHLHCSALSIPESVKHLYHYHILALTKPEVEAAEPEREDTFEIEDEEQPEDYNSPENYCDACELRRDPRSPVYFCKECDFSAHIGCGVAEVLPSLVAEYESRLRSKGEISDPYLINIESELVELRAKVEEVRAKLEALPPNLKELEDERARHLASAERSTENQPSPLI